MFPLERQPFRPINAISVTIPDAARRHSCYPVQTVFRTTVTIKPLTRVPSDATPAQPWRRDPRSTASSHTQTSTAPHKPTSS